MQYLSLFRVAGIEIAHGRGNRFYKNDGVRICLS